MKIRSSFRRLGILAALCGSLAAAPVSAQRVPVGMVVPLTGPLAGVGREVADATRAYLDNLRLPGGRAIELVVFDDGNEPQRTTQAARDLIRQHNPVAFVNCFGTVGCAAQSEVLKAANIPLVGPIAGAQSLRAPSERHVYAIRPSAEREIEALCTHLKSMAVKSIAIVYQDDGFGRAYLPIAKDLVPKLGFEVTIVPLDPKIADYAGAAKLVGPSGVKAVMLLANVQHSAGMLKALSARGVETLALNLAAQANAGFVRNMTGTWTYSVFAVFTPSPWKRAQTVARDYQEAWRAVAADRPFSYLSFEAYLNARVLAEAMARGDRALTARRLMDALEAMPALDFDGLQVKFGPDSRQGSRFADVAVLSSRGQFLQ